MNNVSAGEALALLRGMTKQVSEVKVKRSYVKKGKSFDWIKWEDDEIDLMKQKISKNYSAKEVADMNLFNRHTTSSMYTKFYEVRRKMMRRRKNSPKFTENTVIELPATFGKVVS